MQYDLSLQYTPEFLRGVPLEELRDLLTDVQKRHYELRVQTSLHGRVKYVKRPHWFKKIKKDIARIKTIIREKII